MLHVWSEFNMLAVKYGALNIAHGTPSLEPPQFLIDNLTKAVKDHNQYTMLYGHPILRESIARNYSKILGRDINENTEVLVTCGASASLGATI